MKRTEPHQQGPHTPGEYFTTDECDGCAYCASVAPENFEYDRERNRYYIIRQPLTPVEEDCVREAAEDCPVDAIQKAGIAALT